MYLRKKTAFLAVALVVVICCSVSLLTLPAYAADGEAGSDTDAGQSFWDRIQSAGSAAAEYIDEHKEGWLESAKEGAGKAKNKADELIDSAIEAAPGAKDALVDGISDAYNQFQDFRAEQEDLFYDRFNSQIGLDNTQSSDATPPQETPAESSPTQEPSAGTTAEETPATEEEPAAEPSANADALPSEPGYEMSEDGKTVIINGEEYVKLTDLEKQFLKDGRMRWYTFLFLGIPLLVIAGGACLIVGIKDRFGRRR